MPFPAELPPPSRWIPRQSARTLFMSAILLSPWLARSWQPNSRMIIRRQASLSSGSPVTTSLLVVPRSPASASRQEHFRRVFSTSRQSLPSPSSKCRRLLNSSTESFSSAIDGRRTSTSASSTLSTTAAAATDTTAETTDASATSASALALDLDWERFEFSTSPKRDRRFVPHDDDIQAASGVDELDELCADEAGHDERLAVDLQRRSEAWERLSPELVRMATEALRPYVQVRRLERMKSVLAQRTKHTRFLYENPSNPSNVWACLRTLDSFGIQHVDVVLQSVRYKGKAAISQKRGVRTAVGSAHWLTIRNHKSASEAALELRSQGFRLFASDVNPSARDIRTIDWVAEADRTPICLVMGNEEAGISDEMRELADETFYLPMAGFAESYNLSVATAISCAHLSAASNACNSDGVRGPLRPGDLPDHERDCLLLKGMLNSVANKRIVPGLLKRSGIVLPEEISLL